MDLREKKTKRSIKKAFIQLRSQKPLERITVKELAELAEISKATFYLHYRDIFDLNEVLQEETIQDILAGIKYPENYVYDSKSFLKELINGFTSQQAMIEILFSGNQSAMLPMRIEKKLRSFVRELIPAMDAKQDMLLTYKIQGSFFVYQSHHKKYRAEEVIDFLGDISEMVSDNV